MKNNEIPNNGVKDTGTSCEGLLSGRCPIAQQGGPGRQHITAGRRTSTNRENRLVIECFYFGEPEKLGYRKKCIHFGWKRKSSLLQNKGF